MNTNRKQDLQSHDQSVDLEGLEGLLDHAHVELAPPPEPSEATVIQNLLEQLCRVNELVKDTSERLAGANERLNSLASIVSIQSKQMDLLSHYQAQAARTASLENQLAITNAELELHRRPVWKKLMFWVK